MILQHTPPFTESNISNEIRALEVQRINLMNMKKDIINGVNVVIQELTKKEFKLKEESIRSPFLCDYANFYHESW